MELGNVSFFVSGRLLKEDYFMVCQNSGKFERSHFKTEIILCSNHKTYFFGDFHFSQ